VIIRLKDEHDITSALDAAARHRVALQGLWVETPRPLGAIEWHDRWAEAGIALFVPSIGPYRDVRRQLAHLRQPGLRVFLPATSEENILAIRMLASLNVQTALVLKGTGVPWKALTDLMTYALLRFVPRVAIEPFHFLAASYHPDRPTDYSTVYFDDPRIYLHVNGSGRIALAGDADLPPHVVADSIDQLKDLEEDPAFVERLQAWRASFPEEADACADCEGWGLCMGKFAPQALDDPSCQRFFVQMIEVIRQGQARMNQGGHSWPP
jgi:hypothetical protein